jgi:hypothetical protein
MKRSKFLIVLSILAFVSTPTMAQKRSAAGDRTSVDLTIYNQNLSLIREVRVLPLSAGVSRVVIPDIPSTIDGTSLHFLSLTDPQAVRVLEQNYQYDLIHQAKLLEKYLGKQVEFVRYDQETKKEYSVVGKLLATGYSTIFGSMNPSFSSTGGMIAEINGKIEINPAGRLVLPSLPDGLIMKPQLEWLVSSTRPGDHKAEISYLAGQLSWNCSYVVLLDKTDAKLDLTGWVTLTNSSGTSFMDAGLKLVAGDVNIVRERLAKSLSMRAEVMDGGAPQFVQTELFEYKLYTLQRRTDLNNNEIKQIELTSGKGVPSKKVFIYDGLADQWRYWHHNYSYRSQGSFGQQSNPKVGVVVTFKNDGKSGLGIPLPKGKVRVYKRDNDGKEQFIGEDEIDHTPKDEEVRLYLGNAFDIVGERVQKDFKSLANGRIVEETIEIKVRNHKTEPVEVLVHEHPWRWSQWEIIKSNVEWQKVDQSTLKFPVKIAKDKEGMVVYTIRYSW